VDFQTRFGVSDCQVDAGFVADSREIVFNALAGEPISQKCSRITADETEANCWNPKPDQNPCDIDPFA
jgi:hypothetical protein